MTSALWSFFFPSSTFDQVRFSDSCQKLKPEKQIKTPHFIITAVSFDLKQFIISTRRHFQLPHLLYFITPRHFRCPPWPADLLKSPVHMRQWLDLITVLVCPDVSWCVLMCPDVSRCVCPLLQTGGAAFNGSLSVWLGALEQSRVFTLQQIKVEQLRSSAAPRHKCPHG